MADVRTLPAVWDELVDGDGAPRPAAAALVDRLRSLDIEELQQRQSLAEVDILALGITFTVYHDGQGTDRAWPMDIVPRVIDASEWTRIERGLKQRLNWESSGSWVSRIVTVAGRRFVVVGGNCRLTGVEVT